MSSARVTSMLSSERLFAERLSLPLRHIVVSENAARYETEEGKKISGEVEKDRLPRNYCDSSRALKYATRTPLYVIPCIQNTYVIKTRGRQEGGERERRKRKEL